MVDVMDIPEQNMEQTKEKGGDWQKRSILDEPRLSEAVQLYEETGYEVMIQEVRPEDMDGSSGCMECISGSLKIIYTRKRRGPR